jgi:hypothetical protein
VDLGVGEVEGEEPVVVVPEVVFGLGGVGFVPVERAIGYFFVWGG